MNRIVMVGPEQVDDEISAAQIAWCEANGMNPWHILAGCFVDLTDRVIYATHVVTDAEGALSRIPSSFLARKFALTAVPVDEDGDDMLTTRREHPLLVDPPEGICR